MVNQKVEAICNSDKSTYRGIPSRQRDKWAFRARVWTELRLRHVELEQIHRQKDARFQDALNKIRNGILLSEDEWGALEMKKDMNGAFSSRLMSRRDQVIHFNKRRLSLVRSEEKDWSALDSGRKLFYVDGDELQPRATQILRAKVVLLNNLSFESGLVNGSQGEVVKFVDTTTWPTMPPLGKQAKIKDFQTSQSLLFPVVRFTNGCIATIQPIVQESLRGPSHDRYIVYRAQIPVALDGHPPSTKARE